MLRSVYHPAKVLTQVRKNARQAENSADSETYGGSARSPRSAAALRRRSLGLVGALLGLVGALAPGAAWASGGVEGETFERILTGFAIVGAAYLVSHVVFERVSRRLGIVSGVEYVLLGALVGPVFELISGDVRAGLHPFMVLGTSAIGMSAGIELDLRRGGYTLRDLLAASIIVVVTAAVVVGPPALGLWWFGTPEDLFVWSLPLLAAAAVALVADASPLRAFAAFFDAKSPEIGRAQRLASLSSAAGILSFGALFWLSDGLGPGPSYDSQEALRLLAFQFGAGALIGAIFAIFLRQRLSPERLLTVAIGMVIFTAGLAYFVHVSALATNFLVGLVVANVSGQSGPVREMLRGIRRPLYIVLFFFIGLDLIIDVPWWSYALALPYVYMRLWGRRVGGALARRVGGVGATNVGNALVAPGGLSAGICLMALLFYGQDPTTRQAVAALVVGVVLSELIASVLSRRWIVDVADVPPERATRSGLYTAEEG